MTVQYLDLKAVNLSYSYDSGFLFSDLEFDLSLREALQIVGKNGQGKTTLLRILAGLLAPMNGEVFWKGKSIRQFPEDYRTNLVYLGHLFGFKPYLTAKENLLLISHLRGFSIANHQVVEILNQVGLEKQIHHLTYQLSAGQKQRLALARLLVSKSSLWILDEPFNSLCQEGQHLVRTIIEQHLSTNGMVIFTSHHPINLDGVNVRLLSL